MTTRASELAERIREARASRTPVRVVGRGTWLDAGAPVAARERIDLSAHAGVVEYEPGDLVLTARAGTSLAELARVTAAEGQWLPLDPGGDPEGTIGATVATGSAGPLATAFGTPRDQVLGCELVTGAGDVVRAGGRVVKNVAGFDLTRLMIGAWGTLGVLTEVSLRLRARPAEEVTLAAALRAPDGVERAWRWLREHELRPLAAEVVSPALAARLQLEPGSVMLLRVGGNAALVRAAREAAAVLGPTVRASDDVWVRLAAEEPAGAIVVRWSAAPSAIGTLWRALEPLVTGAGGYLHATIARGVVRCVVPAQDGEMAAPLLRAMRSALPLATLVAERLPAPAWGEMTSAVDDTLSRGIRRAFDPDRLLNPGILAEHA